MSGSLLGRGRAGRLAVYGGCCMLLVLVMFLYRTASTEMAKLRELHIQCAHQQEALAVQLHVNIQYKLQLEKSLAEEKSSNTALKNELQERATREKSLRDKESIEAMQKFNSLQQQHKMLESEYQDLRDDCRKRQKQAQEESNRLEKTLQDLRSQMNKAKEDKKKSLESLKNDYMKIETEKSQLEEKYNELLKNNGNTDSTMEHLRKQVFELKQELEETKSTCKALPSEFDPANSKASQLAPQSNLQKLTPGEQAAISPQQQNHLVTSIPKLSTALSSTKSSTNSAITMAVKSGDVEAPVKLASRMKLPVGVVPIPEMIVPKIDKEDLRKTVIENSPDKRKNQDDREIKTLDNNGHVVGSRHIGEQILERQENPDWYKVKPGVQEIGDEPNNLRKIIPDLEEIHQGADQIGDEQYENIDFYKEAPAKNNDIHLDEGEEEEAEDEEDYPNNPRADKRE